MIVLSLSGYLATVASGGSAFATPFSQSPKASPKHFLSGPILLTIALSHSCSATTYSLATAYLKCLRLQVRATTGATIFAYQVRDPERYGVVSFDEDGRATGIIEKPKNAPSNWAVTGLYFYDKHVVRHAAKVKPSSRGELEITDLNMQYLDAGTLEVARMGRGFAWLDTGTFESLIDAAFFVQTLEQRQGMKIACPEEIAYRMGFINRTRLLELAHSLMKSGYGDYLAGLVAGGL